MKVDWSSVEQDLGRIPDREIADRLGVSFVAVHKHRRRRGILSMHERRERVIVDHLRTHGPTRLVEIALALRENEQSLKVILRRLQDRGRVVKDGPVGTSAPWRAVEVSR